MSMFHSLRVKSVLAALVPIALILVVVGAIGIFSYEQLARDVVRDRDEEIARVTAARLAEQLDTPARLLRELAVTPELRSGDPEQLEAALDEASGALFAFDGGVLVYDRGGVVVTSRPLELGELPQWRDFPDRDQLEVLRVSLRPAFSRVFTDPTTREDLVVLSMPLVDEQNEFAGVLAGMFTLRLSLLSTLFTDVLANEELEGLSLVLVDDRGRVIFHPDAQRVGENLSGFSPVARVIEGERGAEIGRDPSGEEVVSGFAPVPGTGWGVVTQQRWAGIIGPLRDTGRLLLLLLVAGGVLSGLLVFIAVRRVLHPIEELTEGARRLAGGDFGTPIDTELDSELRGLAEQFNAMAATLGELYAGLEHRVEERTAENRRLYEEAQRRAEQLAAMNLRAASVADVAMQSSSLVTIDELLPSVAALLYERFGYYHVDIQLVDADDGGLVLGSAAGQGSNAGELPPRIERGEGILGWVAEHGEAVLANDVTRDPRFFPTEHLPGTEAELAVPIMAGDEVLGVLNVEASERDAFDERDLFTLRTLADQLAVAIENARLFEQSGELAVLEERTRMAREMHDTLAQGFTGIVLQLEAAEQAAEGDPSAIEELHEHLERAKTLARESLQEARRSVWDLMPRALEEQSLDSALATEVREFDRDGHERASFAVRGRSRELPAAVQTALLRISQESLTNVRRHAAATRVDVELRYEVDCVRLVVRDGGAGFDIGAARARGRGGGFGLSGMEQRISQLGGRLELDATLGEGTAVEATIPGGQ